MPDWLSLGLITSAGIQIKCNEPKYQIYKEYKNEKHSEQEDILNCEGTGPGPPSLDAIHVGS